MNFFISDALAQSGGGATPAGGLLQFLPLIVIVVIFYFLLIRPQQKRAKEHKKLIEGLGKGDEVLTSGGLAGRVTDVGDTFASVEIASGVEVRVQKSAVSQVLPKGTLKQTLDKSGAAKEDAAGKKNK
ncbi:MAG TPA: preprotein translocase subunit YajC [Gammaproteobacteria bacterium]|nr:preprotein translocase subunit YajC [Gammaproteobacteria bacterium]